jgi:beta-xylosidase
MAVGQSNFVNPVLPFDYSDPDVIRVGNTYVLTASSFNHVPGLPLLTSTDLVHWKLVGHALTQLSPISHFQQVQHGGGVWAPAIRFHSNRYKIYYPDPDFGIYVTEARTLTGPWSAPKLVMRGKGIIDPCPFWDTDGNAYLAYALAGSRAGMKSMLFMQPMNSAGDTVQGQPVLIYDGHAQDPTIEGPKLYKRNGFYYVFAPAGGVSTGWQLVLRSKHIFGPYERKVVMHQGKTAVNGPHQGAWVQTPKGEDWFVHFRDKDAFGRIMHLQPMAWKGDWPVIGTDSDGDGTGEPVHTSRYPDRLSGKAQSFEEQDTFNGVHISPEWQWNANLDFPNAFPYQDRLQFFARPWSLSEHRNLWMFPNILLRKIYAGPAQIETSIDFSQLKMGERGGFILFGLDYRWIGVTRDSSGWRLQVGTCLQADKGTVEQVEEIALLQRSAVRFVVHINEQAQAIFHYQEMNQPLKRVQTSFTAKPGKWVGAKWGYFVIRPTFINDAGWISVESFQSKPENAP